MAIKKRLIYADDLDYALEKTPIRIAADKVRMFQLIKEAPAVDAVKVVHGRWIWKGGCFHCSNCKTSNDHTPAYCEGCGARMDGDANVV